MPLVRRDSKNPCILDVNHRPHPIFCAIVPEEATLNQVGALGESKFIPTTKSADSPRPNSREMAFLVPAMGKAEKR